MKVYYDLHIHSALSACADDDMTPNNIVNMAKLKGLQAIAVCDHNSAGNLPAFESLAKKAGILLVPGMEFEAAEAVHILCYFQTVRAALDFSDTVYKNMPPVKCSARYFGTQLLMDENDGITGSEPVLLGNSSYIPIPDALKAVRTAGGAAVPSHVDRQSSGIIGVLGCIPDEYGFKAVEYYGGDEDLRTEYEKKYRVLKNSDSHELGAISGRENYLELPELSVRAVLNLLNGRN